MSIEIINIENNSEENIFNKYSIDKFNVKKDDLNSLNNFTDFIQNYNDGNRFKIKVEYAKYSRQDIGIYLPTLSMRIKNLDNLGVRVIECIDKILILNIYFYCTKGDKFYDYNIFCDTSYYSKFEAIEYFMKNIRNIIKMIRANKINLHNLNTCHI